MADSISNTDDIIDSRDVIERIKELEDEREGIAAGLNAEDEDDRLIAQDEVTEWDQDNDEELKTLKRFEEEASNHYDWKHGTTFIHESHFKEYAQQTASDIYGKEIDDARWPFDHIDWDAASDALKMDYTTYDFDGETYYAHS